jgi:hypothetical protein
MLLVVVLVVFAATMGAPGCAKQADGQAAVPSPSTESAPASATVEVPPKGDTAVAPAPPEPKTSDAQALPPSCTKLITCCDAWVQTNPNAKVGCEAQKQAFRAAKSPADRAKLGALCEQALAAWGKISDIPQVCK